MWHDAVDEIASYICEVALIPSELRWQSKRMRSHCASSTLTLAHSEKEKLFEAKAGMSSFFFSQRPSVFINTAALARALSVRMFVTPELPSVHASYIPKDK